MAVSPRHLQYVELRTVLNMLETITMDSSLRDVLCLVKDRRSERISLSENTERLAFIRSVIADLPRTR